MSSSQLLVKQLLQNRRYVFGFAFALTRRAEIAEEIFQEVSVSVLEEASKGTEIPNFTAWVAGVIRNRVADYYRARRQREPFSTALAEAVNWVFDETNETAEEAARRIRGLLDCVDHLPTKQREMVEQHYRDRRPIARIAARMGWKPEAVKVALSKIRKSLADCIRQKNFPERVESV